MHNGRDCAHGRQVGKCDTCDLIDAEQRILELEAQNEQFRDLLIRAVKGEQYIIESDLIAAINSDLQSEISEAIDATPAQCLAEIRAQALEDEARLWPDDLTECSHVKSSLIESANQLRKQAKSGTWLKDSNVHCGAKGE